MPRIRGWFLGVMTVLALAGPGLSRSVHGQGVAFQPIIGQFPSGVTLEATPAVSADRRYVRLSLGANFTNLDGFDTYSVPAAVGGGFAGMNGPIGGLGGLGAFGAAGAGAGPRAGGIEGPFGMKGPSDPPVVAGDPFAAALHASAEPGRPVGSSPSLEADDAGGTVPQVPRAGAARKRSRASALAARHKKAREVRRSR